MKTTYEYMKNMTLDESVDFLSIIIDKEWVDDLMCENGCEFMEQCNKGENCVYSGEIEPALREILNWPIEKYQKTLEKAVEHRIKRSELLQNEFEPMNIRECDLHKYKEFLC